MQIAILFSSLPSLTIHSFAAVQNTRPNMQIMRNVERAYQKLVVSRVKCGFSNIVELFTVMLMKPVTDFFNLGIL
jgi:hypothetical protein